MTHIIIFLCDIVLLVENNRIVLFPLQLNFSPTNIDPTKRKLFHANAMVAELYGTINSWVIYDGLH